MPEPKPLEDLVVNDRFWLEQARKAISGAATARIATADKIVTAVGWFWTLYTAVALVGIALSERRVDTVQSIWMLLPLPLLGATYLLALRAASAIEGTYDPRVPAEVEAAYIQSAKERKNRLQHVGIALAISAISVIVAGVVAGLLGPESPSQSNLVVTRADGSRLLAEATVHKGANVTFIAYGAGDRVLASEISAAQDSGRADAAMTIDADEFHSELCVVTAWTQDSVSYTSTVIIEGSSDSN